MKVVEMKEEVMKEEVMKEEVRVMKAADMTRELSNARINIANMSLCRARRGGDALMVIETDQKVPPVVRTLIEEIPGVKRLTYYEKEAD